MNVSTGPRIDVVGKFPSHMCSFVDKAYMFEFM